MVAKIISGAVIGVDGYIVEVEADLSSGIPGFDIVGLPDSAIRESRERVRTAIKNSGYAFPAKRITINLAPADIRKEGPSFDLPIALGILCCMGVIQERRLNGIYVSGELGLDGTIRPVNGILSMIYGAKQAGARACIVPVANGNEASLVDSIRVSAAASLKELIDGIASGKLPLFHADEDENVESERGFELLDFAHVKGQENTKRALEIAAAGGHNVIMVGPPGSGKTMMAKRIPGILPDLSFTESIEVTKIYSVAGLLGGKGTLLKQRPFRAPHHTISYSALTGGGRIPRPGEISLAHNGVLFLDELPEFNRNVLEVLRQPLEDGAVTISRVSGTITYPADFTLVASMNPCPCGYYGIKGKCTCSPNEISRYLSKISGPLLDRIDIQVEVPKVKYSELGGGSQSESSAAIKNRVLKTRELQAQRFMNDGITLNAQLSSAQIDKYCPLDERCREIIRRAFDVMGLSARGYHKILKIARTIADLDGSADIAANHLSEAIQYRSLDRKYWS